LKPIGQKGKQKGTYVNYDSDTEPNNSNHLILFSVCDYFWKTIKERNYETENRRYEKSNSG
jgi:hypothetical protein